MEKRKRFTQVMIGFMLSMLITISVQGGVPVTFYQNNPLYEKEFSTEINLSGSYSGAPGVKGQLGLLPDIKVYYSLNSNLSLFSSLYYDFIPRRSQTISIGVNEHKIYPNSLNFNLGISWVPQKNQNLSNKYSLSFGIGQALVNYDQYNLSNVKTHSVGSSITVGFFEYNYIFARSKFEHYVSGKLRSRFFHSYDWYHYYENQVTDILNFDDNQQFVFDVMAGYGLKYRINDIKIGFQAGIGVPLNSLEVAEYSDFASHTTTIREVPLVLNLNMVYTFEPKKR